MRAVRILLLAAAFVAGLWFVDWWTIPLFAALHALLWRNRGAGVEAMFAALIATVVLLARQMLGPSFGTLVNTLGQVFPVSGVAVVGITLLLAMLLAYTAARSAIGLAGVRDAR